MQQIDQDHDSEDEGIEDYKIGGFKPINIIKATILFISARC